MHSGSEILHVRYEEVEESGFGKPDSLQYFANRRHRKTMSKQVIRDHTAHIRKNEHGQPRQALQPGVRIQIDLKPLIWECR